MKYLLLIFTVFNSLFATSVQTIKVGVDSEWATRTLGPLAYTVTGFTRCLFEEIDPPRTVSYKLEEIPSQEILKKLESRELSAIFTHLQPTPQNKAKYHFSTPYILLGPVLIVKREEDYSSFTEMKGKKVGYCPSRPFCEIEHIERVQFRAFSSPESALEALDQGALDGVLLGTLEAHVIVPHRYNDSLRIATKPLNDQGIRLITLKDQGKSFFSPFNLCVKKLKKSGIYTRLRLEFGIF